MIMMTRRWTMPSYMIRGNVTAGYFLMKTMVGWMIRRHCFMLRGGMST